MNAAQPILRRLAEVDWGSRQDLARLLEQVTIGETDAREEAWGELWDLVENDGTIDETILPAVPILIALADWHDYPERIHAIVLLREVATAEGIAPAFHHEQFTLLRESLAAGARHLAARWRGETPHVRRALVWLLSAVPEVRVRYHDLIEATLPDDRRAAWEAELVGRTNGNALEE